MDVDAPHYAADHGALRATISELEQRLGALIMQVGLGAEASLLLPSWACKRSCCHAEDDATRHVVQEARLLLVAKNTRRSAVRIAAGC